MSDGVSSYPKGPIETLKKESYISKIEFLVVGFGSSDFSVLHKMAKEMPNGKMSKAMNAKEL